MSAADVLGAPSWGTRNFPRAYRGVGDVHVYYRVLLSTHRTLTPSSISPVVMPRLTSSVSALRAFPPYLPSTRWLSMTVFVHQLHNASNPTTLQPSFGPKPPRGSLPRSFCVRVSCLCVRVCVCCIGYIQYPAVTRLISDDSEITLH